MVHICTYACAIYIFRLYSHELALAAHVAVHGLCRLGDLLGSELCRKEDKAPSWLKPLKMKWTVKFTENLSSTK